jgi:hypothetical protein
MVIKSNADSFPLLIDKRQDRQQFYGIVAEKQIITKG